jgi:hypothetical protein
VNSQELIDNLLVPDSRTKIVDLSMPVSVEYLAMFSVINDNWPQAGATMDHELG